MRSSVLFSLAAIVCSAAAARGQVAPRVGPGQVGQLVLRGPTLLVVAPSTAPDTLAVCTTGCAVAQADSLPCVAIVPGAQLVDRRNGILFVVSSDLALGYVLAAPGRRLMYIPGAVPRSVLDDSVRVFTKPNYRVIIRRHR